jgi:DDE family transposase
MMGDVSHPSYLGAPPMATIPEVARALRAVLTTAADAAAEASGFVRRRSKLTGGVFVQTLVFGWLANPRASLGELSQTSAALGVPVSPQGLDQRFTPAAASCLEQTLAAAVGTVVTADPVAVPILARFNGVYVQDSTTVGLPAALAERWPGCGNASAPAARSAALKLQVRLELTTGALDGPVPHAGRAHDRAAPPVGATLPRGALRLADLGYFSLDGLRDLDRDGVFWLSRLQVQTAVFAADGRRRDVPALLAAQGADAVDLPVTLGGAHRLPARLLAVRVPPAVAAERRRRLHAEARRRGQTVSRARLAGADWTILVTNAPAALLTLEEGLVLARARWQIELLFKLWKAHGGLDDWRTANPDRILCEVYAKLLALVVQHWLLLVWCWASPDRSLTKAARTVRQHALALAGAFAAPARLRAAIATLGRCLRTGCRINKRRAAPATYQLLLQFPDLARIDHADDDLAA